MREERDYRLVPSRLDDLINNQIEVKEPPSEKILVLFVDNFGDMSPKQFDRRDQEFVQPRIQKERLLLVFIANSFEAYPRQFLRLSQIGGATKIAMEPNIQVPFELVVSLKGS